MLLRALESQHLRMEWDGCDPPAHRRHHYRLLLMRALHHHCAVAALDSNRSVVALVPVRSAHYLLIETIDSYWRTMLLIHRAVTAGRIALRRRMTVGSLLEHPMTVPALKRLAAVAVVADAVHRVADPVEALIDGAAEGSEAEVAV